MKAITWTLEARRMLRAIPSPMRKAIEHKLDRFAETGAGDRKQLKGRSGSRLRIGNYRVILVGTADTIESRAVGHWRDIYR